MTQGQLSFTFEDSSAVRTRRAKTPSQGPQLTMFAFAANIDVHLHSPVEAVAQLSGSDVDRAAKWLESIVGSLHYISSRRVAFASIHLDRLLAVRPPAVVTLDAASAAVARALWAHAMGLKPLRVTRHRQRLLAGSPRWPTGLGVVDAPWPAIATLLHYKIPLDIDTKAQALMHKKMADSNQRIARAWLAGSAVMIETAQPTLIESLGLPALAYAGTPDSGRYRVPLLAASQILEEPAIEVPADLAAAIKKANQRTRPLSSLEGFPWELYPFQARDAATALRIVETAGGVLLAGDMGSGKTTVSLALVQTLDLWPLLVVCPLAAMSTWARQLGEMGRNYYMASESPATSWQKIETGGYEAVVISYDRLHAFSEVIEHVGFAAIVADELQRIRTPGSRRSRALRSLAQSVPVRIGLSGTPLQNRIEDLLAPASFLVPGEFKPRASAKDLSDLYPGDPIEAIAEHVGTLMVRRRMEDTGVKLPNKSVRRLYVDLTAEQRHALQTLESEAAHAAEDGELDRMHAFVKLQKMRQIISCPSMADVGGVSPKVEAAIELVEEFVALDRKCVIFCANRKTWTDLADSLKRLGIGYTGIWGSTPIGERISNEKKFHTDTDTKVFIGTIQSCAESLTLSPTGTVVIHCDYVYNPSDLAQAEARVYRMNQTNPVDVIYLHAAAHGGTLDDRMAEILEVKRALFAKVIDRTEYQNNSEVSYSLGDLVFLLTGSRDEKIDQREKTRKAVAKKEQDLKRHARVTLYKNKGKNRYSDDFFDDGSTAIVLEDLSSGRPSAHPDELLDDLDDLDLPDGFDDVDEDFDVAEEFDVAEDDED